MRSSEILRIFARSFSGSFFRSLYLLQLSRWIHLGLFVVFFLSFSSHALTSQTTKNHIEGSAPYLTFDGGRTRVVDANGLLGITLSDGTRYTPSTNSSSSSRPISLPVEGQSFADIDMFVPTNTNSVDLSTLIGPPNNYWGDDDGDAGVTATGRLSLSIVDKNNQLVSRDTVLTTCNDSAPYRVTLTSTDGTLSTRYGVPSSSTFRESSVTYYVNPKLGTSVCARIDFAIPNLIFGTDDYAGPASMWDPYYGFLTQKTDPSSYGQNFPTTGINNLRFGLEISNVSQPLFWSSVSKGGITATMSDSSSHFVRVTLTGPYATESQWNSSNPGFIAKPSLPQTFELVGRDAQGNPVVKYGFTLKQWFLSRGDVHGHYSDHLSWCNSFGYRMPSVKDLTNASCRNTNLSCRGAASATPSSPSNHFMRHIGSGLFAEWGHMSDYSAIDLPVNANWFFTSDSNGREQFIVHSDNGAVDSTSENVFGLCTYP